MSVKNKKLVERIIRMFTSNNNGKYLNYLDNDITWNIVGMPAITGRSEFLRTVSSLELKNFSSSKIINIISEGEFVVVESISGTIPEIRNSDTPAYCDIYRIKDGKIRELTTYIVDTTPNIET
jgi:predicted SnoaL-like aldol condensation-catalyzing enzyme